MMEAEIKTIQRALKVINHADDSMRERALAAERALDAIAAVLKSFGESNDKAKTAPSGKKKAQP